MTTLKERETALDEAALEAFADRMIGVLNDGCTALLTSIGHQTGLFSTLAATRPGDVGTGRRGRRAERALRAGVAERDDHRAVRALRPGVA